MQRRAKVAEAPPSPPALPPFSAPLGRHGPPSWPPVLIFGGTGAQARPPRDGRGAVLYISREPPSILILLILLGTGLGGPKVVWEVACFDCLINLTPLTL